VATVAWEIDGAATIRMMVDPGGMVDLTDKSPRADEAEITFFGPGTITVIASNPAGQTTRVIDAPVDPVPTIRPFFAAPSRVGSGEAVEIHWETLDAQSVRLEADGVEVAVAPTNVNGNFTTDILPATSSYVLHATNGLGFEVTSQPLVVEVGAPAITSFVTSDGRSLYPAGSTVEFLWENDGGSRLSLTDEAGNLVCSPTEWAVIRQGGCSVTLPGSQEFKTFTLQVANGSGTDTESLVIGAVTGPIVTSFTVDRPEMTEGESINFSWITVPDADGNVPTLTLVDQDGTVYPLDEADPLEDSKRFQIPTWGDYTFTLTATTEIDPPFPVELPLTVYGVPVIGDLASNPPFAEDEGDAITFSWTSTHGDSLEILALDRDGNTGATLFASSSKAEVDAGSASLQPTIAAPNVRLLVRNPLGAPSHKDLRIGVNPATITSFTANGVEAPAVVDVLFGDDLTIAWETARATDAWYQEGFVDISKRPNAEELAFSGTLGSTSIQSFSFPQGFAFPFDGEVYTEARIALSGWLSFDMAASGSGTNSALPNSSVTYQRPDLLPFWDSFNGGKIWWERIEGDVDQLIIQWTDMNFTTSSYNPADVTFQAVLFADGSFEYRYGKMESNNVGMAKASSATIAAQNRAGTEATVLVHNQLQEPGLEGRVYRFRGWDDFVEASSTPVRTPLAGSVTFQPKQDRTYHLAAWNGHSDHVEELEVRVHPKGQLHVAAIPAEPLPGDSVTLHWSGVNLTALTIEDDTGAIIHTAAAAELAGGSLDLGVLAQGVHRFRFHADGVVAWNRFTEELVVSANDPFSLDTFAATDTLIKRTDPPVTLSWETTGATSGTITELPSGVVHHIPAGDLALGTLQVTPQTTTTYVLDLESHERFRQAELVVEVRTVWIEEFTASKLAIPAGGSATLRWDTTAGGTASLHPVEGSSLELVETTAPFEDIRGLGAPHFGQNADSAISSARFPDGFTFPYFGEVHDRVYFAVDGYASFDPGLTTVAGNVTIPGATVANQRMHLPIFWDDLHTGVSGNVYTAYLPNPDRFIVQWSEFQRYYPTTRGYDLNFQIVLFPNGSFEYRYGDMSAPATPATSTTYCNPYSCEHEVAGSSATIGYQALAGTVGYELHFGGASSTNPPPFTGGLAHRAFLFDTTVPNGVGSKTVSPGESTTYTLCIEDADWKECQEVYVNVVRPGDLLISELMVSPANGIDGQWFEIRNISQGDLDLEGMAIEMGATTHTIQTGAPLVLPKGGHAVLARTGDPALAPDYVYGSTMELTAPAGDVSIVWDGVKMGEASWTSSWTFTPGVSLGLDPAKVRPGVVTRWIFDDFCEARASYDGGVNLGTPGSLSDCGTHGYLFDPFSTKPFIDIRATGSRSTILHADTASSYLTNGLGFTFPFYGTMQDELWMNSNGLIGFGNANASSSAANRDLHGTLTTVNTGIVAGFWDDLTVADDGLSWVGFHLLTVDGQRVRIVQYDGVKRYGQTGAITFQIQLWESGDIVIAFGDLVGGDHYRGGDATIGIEAPGGATPIQYLYNQAILRPHQSLYFHKL
jgi:hypothetical protein